LREDVERMVFPRACLALVLVFFLPRGAHAVVVAGANGGGNTTNNTTAAQMSAQLGLTNTAFYNNVLPYSDAGSVYLGWANTPNGPRAYLLSAMHISLSSTMLINSVSYSVTRQSISNSDLALLTLSNVDGIMPSLPVVNLSTATPRVGTAVIMAGFGRNRVQAATTNAAVSDAITLTNGTGYTTTTPQVLRWGTNATVRASSFSPFPTIDITVAGRTSTVTATQFDTPATNAWLTTSEAQAVLGDSGGGLFGTNGTLLGIVAAVSANRLEAEFGEKTFFTDVATYKKAVDDAIGYPLVPEPSTSLLLFFGAGAAIWFAMLRRG
jgi:hypothetical protein